VSAFQHLWCDWLPRLTFAWLGGASRPRRASIGRCRPTLFGRLLSVHLRAMGYGVSLSSSSAFLCPSAFLRLPPPLCQLRRTRCAEWCLRVNSMCGKGARQHCGGSDKGARRGAAVAPTNGRDGIAIATNEEMHLARPNACSAVSLRAGPPGSRHREPGRVH
jgi:hypothetical protein